MEKEYLEAGKIVNTHGIRGEVKITPWCDSAQFLSGFSVFYIDGVPVNIISSHVHKDNLLVKFEHIADINDAMRLKGKIISIDRKSANLPAGHHFIDDLIGLSVTDEQSGTVLGKITDILTPPANDVYVVTGQRTYMIPAVKEFVLSIDIEAGFVRVRLIEGMAADED